MKKKILYDSPNIRVIEATIEKGYAGSSDTNEGTEPVNSSGNEYTFD